ncbi:hypothetical protein EAF04_009009 [Stromatinia cepivora]|nr:hypothetical protein EAF04_009009 [Stromatinia cepivora]
MHGKHECMCVMILALLECCQESRRNTCGVQEACDDPANIMTLLAAHKTCSDVSPGIATHALRTPNHCGPSRLLVLGIGDMESNSQKLAASRKITVLLRSAVVEERKHMAKMTVVSKKEKTGY